MRRLKASATPPPDGMFYTFSFAAMIVFAVFFYRAGDLEGAPKIFWAALSVAISLAIWQWLKWGTLAMVFGQVLLFLAIGFIRALRKR